MSRDPRPGTVPVDPRTVAAGGWRRALVGLAVGIVAGAAVALVVPRDAERRHGGPAATRER